MGRRSYSLDATSTAAEGGKLMKTLSNEEFRSNCLIEALKAKIRNPNVKILYIPGYLNEVPCRVCYDHDKWKGVEDGH